MLDRTGRTLSEKTHNLVIRADEVEWHAGEYSIVTSLSANTSSCVGSTPASVSVQHLNDVNDVFGRSTVIVNSLGRGEELRVHFFQ